MLTSQWYDSTLVQAIKWCLFGTNTLHEPMLTYCPFLNFRNVASQVARNGKKNKTNYPLNSNYEKIISKMGIYAIVYAVGASPIHKMLSWSLGLWLIAKCPYYSIDLAPLVRQGRMLIFLSSTYSFLAILSYIIYDSLYVFLPYWLNMMQISVTHCKPVVYSLLQQWRYCRL